MKLPLSGSQLLLILEERRITAIRLSGSRTGRPPAVFSLPESLNYTQPAALGRALGEFLRQHHLSARRTTLALPGRWLLLPSIVLPPASAQTARQMLRLKLETLLGSDARNWQADCVALQDSTEPLVAPVAAIERQRLEQLQQMVRAAGGEAQAVTSTLLWLACLQARRSPEPVVLICRDQQGAETALISRGRVQLATVLNTPAATVENTEQTAQLLAAEVQRTLALAPAPAVDQPPQTLVFFDHAGDSSTLGPLLAERLNLRLVRVPESVAEFLSRSGFVAEAPNLVHSRLEPARPRRLTGRQRAVVGGVAGAVVLAAVAGWDYWKIQSEIQQLESQLAELAPAVRQAQADLDRIQLARQWFPPFASSGQPDQPVPDSRPSYLECLRQISLALPQRAAVWANSLAMRDDLSGTFAGKAQDERTVLELMDRLKATGAFADVKLLYLRQADRRSREVAFAVNFVFRQVKGEKP